MMILYAMIVSMLITLNVVARVNEDRLYWCYRYVKILSAKNVSRDTTIIAMVVKKWYPVEDIAYYCDDTGNIYCKECGEEQSIEQCSGCGNYFGRDYVRINGSLSTVSTV